MLSNGVGGLCWSVAATKSRDTSSLIHTRYRRRMIQLFNINAMNDISDFSSAAVRHHLPGRTPKLASAFRTNQEEVRRDF